MNVSDPWRVTHRMAAALRSQTQKDLGLNISPPLRQIDQEIEADFYF